MRKATWLTLAVYAALAGCHSNTGVSSEAPKARASAPAAVKPLSDKTVLANLVGYNHTNKTIAEFYVNGVWGGNITPGSGGGSFVCCADLPDPWPEGYTVTITWQDHEGKMQKRVVPVPKYDPKTLSDLNVHFLRSGEIKVFALRMTLGHPDYPLTGQEAELKPGVPIKKVY